MIHFTIHYQIFILITTLIGKQVKNFPTYIMNKNLKHKEGEELQDGGRVRCGDHLPPHKYIRNTSTCGTTPTEPLLNAGRRPQTSQKAIKSPHNWEGQKKKQRQRIGTGPAPVGGSCEGGKVSTH